MIKPADTPLLADDRTGPHPGPRTVVLHGTTTAMTVHLGPRVERPPSGARPVEKRTPHPVRCIRLKKRHVAPPKNVKPPPEEIRPLLEGFLEEELRFDQTG